MDSQIQRQRRINVDIPVTITTVLDSFDAAIVDMTEHGAQIIGCSLASGTRFQIEYMGQTVYALCRWAEVDRMGIKFSFPLTDGPLFERLMLARAMQAPNATGHEQHIAYSTMGDRASMPGMRSFGRAATSGFGRRTG
jgi:hypothetical protein